MPRFFSEKVHGNQHIFEGNDARHIARSLRMKTGDKLTLCDSRGMDYECEIAAVTEDTVHLNIVSWSPSTSEPSIHVKLYQGLPKSDKLEWIIQKAVELGVTEIVPVVTARSIAKVDEKADKKRERWQKIALEAAGQCGRGIVPVVRSPLTWKQAIAELQKEQVITFYEGGGKPLSQILKQDQKDCSIIIGPEGGFDLTEIEVLQDIGAKIATLGPRILRCETAPIAALSVIMQITGNLE